MCAAAQSLHPAPVLPLALKLVATGKRMSAAPILEASLPVALIARAVRVDAHPYPMHLSFLDVAIVFALHCFDDKNRLGLVEEREENNRYRRPPRGAGPAGLLLL